MAYTPQPLDTSDVRLSADILDLIERLAENTHEVWSRGRVGQGWTWGPRRDDDQKHHPCLVPYDRLSESEKDYDRATTAESLKAILKLGYRIEKSGSATVSTPAAATGDPLADIQAQLRSARSLKDMLAVWKGRKTEDWSIRPDAYRLLARKLVQSGHPLAAYDVAEEGLKHFKGDLRLRQYKGLALARSGATNASEVVLRELEAEGHADAETLGQLARTYKDLWDAATDPAEKAAKLRDAAQRYKAAYDKTGDYYPGINAATLLLLQGETATAKALAAEIIPKCKAELERADQPVDDPYWPLATLGEASLVLGDWTSAETYYRQAIDAGAGRYGDIHSTRRNARMILNALGRDSSSIDACFSMPAVVLFCGHMIDEPGRATPRFPAHLEPHVRGAIEQALQEVDAGIGFSSSTCGSDILFLEAMQARRGETHVVLPYREEEFITDTVDIIPGADWAQRAKAVLRNASEVSAASDHRLIGGGGVAYEYGNNVLHGLARIRARQLEAKLIPLVVWDGKASEGPTGTARIVELWQNAGLDVKVIDLSALAAKHGQPGTLAPAAPASAPPALVSIKRTLPSKVVSLLFADVAGFSKLTEDQVPPFVEHFMGLVGRVAAGGRNPPELRNTWGDGLFLVFSSVRDAGLFALNLCEEIVKVKWQQWGLPADMHLRIALHAGPVYKTMDPVTERDNCLGTHVSRAARMEPVTPKGVVYASEPFAAIATAENVPDFRCDYVGQIELPKGFGTYPMFNVRRR